MKLSFTLDTNCICALDEGRPEATDIRQIVDAHDGRIVDVAFVAISASENQRPGKEIENYAQFAARISSLGLGKLTELQPMAYWDVGFWDHAIYSDEAMQDVERGIHNILFPSVPFNWSDYCERENMDPNASNQNTRWRNAKCDVQAFWAHVQNRRNVFVTTDGNFHKVTKRPQLMALARGAIETPHSALTHLYKRCLS